MSVKDDRTIDEKMTDLDKMVAWFDGEEFKIDEALAKFKEAKELANEIENDLANVKNQINVISKKFDKD